MTPEQHLGAAKEGVAKENFYDSWQELEDNENEDVTKDILIEAYNLALTNQAKELESVNAQLKEACDYNNELTQNGGLLNQVKELELENKELKSELSKSTEDKARMLSTIDEQRATIEVFREERDSYREKFNFESEQNQKSTEEKAKAFDEGCIAMGQSMVDDLQITNSTPTKIINPYRDKANEAGQDLQKSI
jgi:hypothetical protein